MNDEMLMALYEAERKQNAQYIMTEVRVEEDRADAFVATIHDIRAENFDCKIRRREVDADATVWCVIEVSGEIGGAYRQYLEHIGFKAELERLKTKPEPEASALCLNCDVAFHPPEIMPAVFIVHVAFCDPSAAMMNGVCEHCARTGGDWHARSLQLLRQVFPDAHLSKYPATEN